MKKYTLRELHELIRNKFTDKHYFQKFKYISEEEKDTVLIFGIWLTPEDCMDYAGEVSLAELLENTRTTLIEKK